MMNESEVHYSVIVIVAQVATHKTSHRPLLKVVHTKSTKRRIIFSFGEIIIIVHSTKRFRNKIIINDLLAVIMSSNLFDWIRLMAELIKIPLNHPDRRICCVLSQMDKNN